MLTFISIEYDTKYKKVVLSKKDKEIIAEFSSGDIVKDWEYLIDYCVNNPAHYSFLSSVDHFVFDIPGYRWDIDEVGNEIIVKET